MAPLGWEVPKQKNGLVFYSVQALRFFAAMAVAQFHLWPLPSTVQVGGAGVDVFFVISGLVIGLTKPEETPYSFLMKRLIRIYPLYWVATIITVAFPFYEWGAESLPDWNAVWSSFLLLPNSARWHPIYFAAWTLTFELFFYFLYGALLTILPRYAVKAVCVGALLVLSQGSFLGAYTGLLIEFSAGLLVSELVARKFVLPRSAALVAIIIALGGFVFCYEATVWPLPQRQIVWGIPSFLLVYGVISFEGTALARSRFLRAAGEASYAIYLIHVTMGAIIIEYCRRHDIEPESAPFMLMIVSMGAAMGAGFCLHYFAERPFLRVLRGALLPRRVIAEPLAPVAATR